MPTPDPSPQRLHDLRLDYADTSFELDELEPDPIEQFRKWFEDARRDPEIREPNVMTLATVSQGGPRARQVLLKEIRDQGFVFFTNYDSAKGEQLLADPRVALVFHWDRLERQVRVTGRAEVIPSEESDRYFAARPRRSQLAAIASPQSKRLASREELDSRYRRTEALFPEGVTIPRPENWGGVLVRPVSLEFWQGRRSRLHDRLRYVRDGEVWRAERLGP